MSDPNSISDRAKAALAGIGAMFPGRTRLYIREAARAMQIEQAQVFELIELGELGVEDINGRQLTPDERAANKPARNRWRVPVTALAAFAGNQASATPLE